MRHPELAANLHMPTTPGMAGRRLLSTVNEDKLRRILTKMLDEKEFFGPHGIRALSLYHREHPFEFDMNGQKYSVGYLPGDSDSGMFGGNSNWRGPVWMPVNFLLYTSLLRLGAYYGDTFKIECPTGSGKSDDSVRSCQRAGRAAHRNVRQRQLRQAASVWRRGEVSNGSALARQCAVLRVLPRRYGGWRWSQSPDGMDRMHRADYSGERSLRREGSPGSVMSSGARSGSGRVRPWRRLVVPCSRNRKSRREELVTSNPSAFPVHKMPQTCQLYHAFNRVLHHQNAHFSGKLPSPPRTKKSVTY